MKWAWAGSRFISFICGFCQGTFSPQAEAQTNNSVRKVLRECFMVIVILNRTEKSHKKRYAEVHYKAVKYRNHYEALTGIAGDDG